MQPTTPVNNHPKPIALQPVTNTQTGLAYTTLTDQAAHWCLILRNNGTEKTAGGTIPRNNNETDTQLSNQATLRALEHALEHAAEDHLNIYVFDPAARSAVASLGLRKLTLAPRIHEGDLEKAIQYTADLAGTPLAGVTHLRPKTAHTWAQRDVIRAQNAPSNEPIMVSSDASMGRRTKDAGLGWVIDWPEKAPTCGASSIKAANILTAELKAIETAVKEVLKTVSSGRPVHFHSDSQIAVNGIIAAHAGKPPARMNSSQAGIVDRITQLRRHYNFTFTWVKGHNGDNLNETADRLAVAARRCKEMHIPTDVRQAMVERITESVHLPLAS